MLLLAAMACRVVDTCVELADLLSVVAVQVSIRPIVGARPSGEGEDRGDKTAAV